MLTCLGGVYVGYKMVVGYVITVYILCSPARGMVTGLAISSVSTHVATSGAAFGRFGIGVVGCIGAKVLCRWSVLVWDYCVWAETGWMVTTFAEVAMVGVDYISQAEDRYV